jgi:hypothetical protein
MAAVEALTTLANSAMFVHPLFKSVYLSKVCKTCHSVPDMDFKSWAGAWALLWSLAVSLPWAVSALGSWALGALGASALGSFLLGPWAPFCCLMPQSKSFSMIVMFLEVNGSQ